jgi:hypothetical protein
MAAVSKLTLWIENVMQSAHSTFQWAMLESGYACLLCLRVAILTCHSNTCLSLVWSWTLEGRKLNKSIAFEELQLQKKASDFALPPTTTHS